jgi:hypothetical protein
MPLPRWRPVTIDDAANDLAELLSLSHQPSTRTAAKAFLSTPDENPSPRSHPPPGPSPRVVTPQRSPQRSTRFIRGGGLQSTVKKATPKLSPQKLSVERQERKVEFATELEQPEFNAAADSPLVSEMSPARCDCVDAAVQTEPVAATDATHDADELRRVVAAQAARIEQLERQLEGFIEDEIERGAQRLQEQLAELDDE